MKRRLLALVLALGLLLPAGAGAAQAPDAAEAPPAPPETATRGWFLQTLALNAGEDVSDSAWIDMEEYFTDGADVSDEIKWTFDKWILNGDGDGETLGTLRLTTPSPGRKRRRSSGGTWTTDTPRCPRAAAPARPRVTTLRSGRKTA